MSTCGVYRLYDDQDVLLYVGMAYNVAARVETHSLTSPFGSQIARVEAELYDTRTEAAAAERQAIRVLRPRWNSKCRPARKDWTACDYFEEIERVSLYQMKGYEPWERRLRVMVSEFLARYPDIAEQTLPVVTLPFALRAAA